MARYERENTRPVLADVGTGAGPDPNVVVAHVGPDGKVQLSLNIDATAPAAASEADVEATPEPESPA